MAGFSDATQQAKQFWATRNGGQKGILLAAGGVTVLLLTLFVRFIGTPDYKPLYTGLETADAQTLTAQLDAQGIAHETSADGKTISVPADKLDAARLQTAAQGAPHSGRMGFELFDKMSWGQTEFDEKVTYQRALEGELERTIQTLADVDSARVHLVMATDSVFMDHQRGAKASVVLKLRHNTLSKESVMAISRLVSGAVDELKPADVSIVDADSDRSLGLGHDGTDNNNEDAESSLTQRLIATLEPVIGQDKIRASVNVDYDQATTDETQEKYDPAVSALLSDQKTDDEAAGGAAAPAAGVPGTSSNVPSKVPKAPTTPDPTQSSKSETAQYGVNKTETHTMLPAGRILRLTAAILVDDQVVKTTQGKNVTYKKVKRSQEELQKIQQLAEAAIGFDAKRGDTISVQDLSFDVASDPTDVAPPNVVDKVQKSVMEYANLLRPASLLVLFILAYLFAIRPVQKQLLGAMQAQPMPPALPAPQKTDRFGSADSAEGAKRAAQLREQTIEGIKQKPEDTTRALQAWLREGQA
jgi:flagellar M-ring protein FliF